MAAPDRSKYEPIGGPSECPPSLKKRLFAIIIFLLVAGVVALILLLTKWQVPVEQHANATDITNKILKKLNKQMKGMVLFPNHTDFINASHVWSPNEGDDAEPPLAVVEPANEKDVVLAVPILASLFLQQNVTFRIKSGGHSIPGWSSVPGGIILSLAKLNHVHLNTTTGVAVVGPAATMQDILKKSLRAGFGGVVGFCPGVAIGGFALGGGLGVQTRLYGLGLDNILSARMVKSDGTIVVASSSSSDDTDLFFALRGAGNNNFGVVTEMHYQLHPTPNNTGSKHRKELLSVTGLVPLKMIPKLNVKLGAMEPKIPRNWYIMYDGGLEKDGPRALPMAFYYTGDMVVGKEYAKRQILSWFPREVADAFEIKKHSWYDWTIENGNLDGNYARAWTGFLNPHNNTIDVWTRIQDALTTACDISPYLMVDVELMAGAVGDRASQETAFPFRHSLWFVSLLLVVPVENGKNVFDDLVQQVDDAIWPNIQTYFDGVYLNYPMESLDNEEYPRMYWGDNLDRLMLLKAKYDPDNIFRHPQSVPLPQE